MISDFLQCDSSSFNSVPIIRTSEVFWQISTIFSSSENRDYDISSITQSGAHLRCSASIKVASASAMFDTVSFISLVCDIDILLSFKQSKKIFYLLVNIDILVSKNISSKLLTNGIEMHLALQVTNYDMLYLDLFISYFCKSFSK